MPRCRVDLEAIVASTISPYQVTNGSNCREIHQHHGASWRITAHHGDSSNHSPHSSCFLAAGLIWKRYQHRLTNKFSLSRDTIDRSSIDTAAMIRKWRGFTRADEFTLIPTQAKANIRAPPPLTKADQRVAIDLVLQQQPQLGSVSRRISDKAPKPPASPTNERGES
jgi:hypothetical protein